MWERFKFSEDSRKAGQPVRVVEVVGESIRLPGSGEWRREPARRDKGHPVKGDQTPPEAPPFRAE